MGYNPFLLDLPGAVAFSGGRTSGYMLHEIWKAHEGKEKPHVVFCNTGKERPETLDFVEEVSQQWSIPVVWLEYRHRDGHHVYEQVDYQTASRDGRPFDEVIRARSYPPNRMARFCTAELKVKTMWRWAKDAGLAETGYTKAVGLRYDEPGRVQRLLGNAGDFRTSEEIVCPLHESKKTIYDVNEFWRAQPFDLHLKPHEGNCDLCFLKGRGKIHAILQERPDLADWWIDKEADGKLFRSSNDRPRYSLLLAEARLPTLFDGLEDECDIPCGCTD